MLAALCALTTFTTAVPNTLQKPRLVLVISIDQFRGDYIKRFEPYFLPPKQGGSVGGFRYLTESGSYYSDAHHMHVPTATGPGHSVILTGSTPAINGIAGNEWFDRKTRKDVYCVDDASVQTVGGASGPMSPRNLHVTTVGDELKMATNGKAKIVGISFKDRAAILMAGHAADTVIWLDGGNASWVTSTFYAKDKKLPTWVDEVNSKHRADADLQSTWTPLLSDSAYDVARPAPFVKGLPSAPVFSHKIAGASKGAGYRNWTTSSFGQQYLFDTAKASIAGEDLGKDETPDILAINLATNDYIGHAYGPNSPEVMDITVRTDRMLSDLFNFLEKNVKGGINNVAIVLTADHGVVPIVEEARDTYRMVTTKRVNEANITKEVDAALSAKYGSGKYVLSTGSPNLYLDQELLKQKNVNIAEAQESAAAVVGNFEGVYCAFSASNIMRGNLPGWPWVNRVYNGFHPKLSGDVMFFEDPGSYFGGGTGTGHGSPWDYDSHVPIVIKAQGLKTGTFAERVATQDIAPTLCRILSIELPTGNVGHQLPGIFK